MTGLSSYYRNDTSGLGADDQLALPLADQTLLGFAKLAPSVVYTEWAEQTGDVGWNEKTPSSNYRAYPIVDQQLVATSQLAKDLPHTLAVVSDVLAFSATVDKAFKGTPYKYVSTEAIYAQLDPASPPQPYFLYWLALRVAGDPDLGNVSLNYGALQVRGVLSYITEIGKSASDRPRPSIPFPQVIANRQGQPPVTVPSTPAQQTTTAPVLPGPSSTQEASLSSTGDKTKAVLIVGLGAAAAFGAYKLMKGSG